MMHCGTEGGGDNIPRDITMDIPMGIQLDPVTRNLSHNCELSNWLLIAGLARG